jgi:hypothetical protein
VKLRSVVVSLRVAEFGPLGVVSDGGVTVHVVACAGTVQESDTGDENPENGVTPISLMYDAVCPAVTVCEAAPRL